MARVLALPLSVGASGQMVTVEQDSAADIAQSLGLLLETRPGERRSEPEYGLPDPLFDGVDVDEITELVYRWEERADQLTIEQHIAGLVDVLEIHAAHTPIAEDDADELEDEEV